MKWSWIIVSLIAPIGLIAQPTYGVKDITNGNGYFGTPWGLNDLGDVVGDLNFHAFYWRAGRIIQPPPLLTGFSTARAINNLGDIVGGGLDERSNAVALLIRDGVVHEMPIAGSTWAIAVAINDAGDILINSTIGQRGTAFRWRAGAVAEIGSASYKYLSGSAVDERGRIVGAYVKPESSLGRAFLWDSKLVDLGLLPGGDFESNSAFFGPASSAHGINGAGQVVGASTAPGQLSHAFLWSNGAMTDLGALEGQNRSAALSINDAGQIVGYSAQAAGVIVSDARAVLWDHQAIYDLNSLIPPGSGWQLEQAFRINSRGEIAASGRLNGQLRPVLLTPLKHPAIPAARQPHSNWKP